MTVSERHALFLKSFPFYAALPQERQEAICARATSAEYSGGVALCGLRGRCIGILLVTRGRARAFTRSAEGREITLCRLAVGDIFVMPASGLFGIGDFEVTLEAEGHLTVELFAPAAVTELFCGPDIENFFLRTTVSWYGEAMNSVRRILLERLDRRLASFLVGEVDRHGGDTVYLTQDEIARQIGSAREAVSRMLKTFAAEGWITVLRGGVRLRDVRALRAMCTD